MTSVTRPVVRNFRALQKAELHVSVIVTLRFTARSTAKGSWDTLSAQQWAALAGEILGPTMWTARNVVGGSAMSKLAHRFAGQRCWYAPIRCRHHGMVRFDICCWASTNGVGVLGVCRFSAVASHAFLNDNFLIVHGLLGTIWWYFLTMALGRCLVAFKAAFGRE